MKTVDTIPTVFAEPRQILNASEAADLLGISRAMLWQLGKRHQLYKASVPDLPGAKRAVNRFHREHLRLIEAVLVEAISEDEALEEWQTRKQLMARRVVPLEDRPRRLRQKAS